LSGGRRLEVAGVETFFHDVGEGPAVLLLHGSGPGVSAWSNWRLLIPVLAGSHRVIAPDLLGFGGTDPAPGGTYSREIWVNHLMSLLDQLALEQVNVVGNSFGAAMALRLAIDHPHRVDRLVMMGPIGMRFELTAGLDQAWGYTPSLENMRALLDLFAYDRGLVSDDLAHARYEASIGTQEAFAAMFPPPRQRWVDELASRDEEIAKISHPLLLVHGRDDRVIPLANSLHLLGLIDDCQLHVFGRSGHWVQIEHAAAFNRLVAGFLA
jgi:2-hydroxymuconate-semialdehyde hydrolase